MNKKNEYIKSEPYFFRIITFSGAFIIAIVIILAFFIDAPLQPPANSSRVPNPSKAAWFLLWIQEVVSYSTYFIYIVIFLLFFYIFIPYLPIKTENKAIWFRKNHILINLFTIIVFILILTLTLIGYYFRGEFWQLVL